MLKSAMHINVRDLLAEDVGFNRTFTIDGERPTMFSLNLVEPVNGEVTLTKLEGDQLLVTGRISSQLELECHRCLRSYITEANRSFEQLYALDPADDELPIASDQIDLAPLIEQELIVGLPIKQLCEAGCIGVPGADGYYVNKQGT